MVIFPHGEDRSLLASSMLGYRVTHTVIHIKPICRTGSHPLHLAQHLLRTLYLIRYSRIGISAVRSGFHLRNALSDVATDLAAASSV